MVKIYRNDIHSLLCAIKISKQTKVLPKSLYFGRQSKKPFTNICFSLWNISISWKKKALAQELHLQDILVNMWTSCRVTERVMLERVCIRLTPVHEFAVLGPCSIPLIPWKLREEQSQLCSKDLFARISPRWRTCELCCMAH